MVEHLCMHKSVGMDAWWDNPSSSTTWRITEQLTINNYAAWQAAVSGQLKPRRMDPVDVIRFVGELILGYTAFWWHIFMALIMMISVLMFACPWLRPGTHDTGAVDVSREMPLPLVVA